MLKKSPDCDHDVSDLAPACPNCGRPMMAQTIAATPKKWKEVSGCGLVIAAIGGLLLIHNVVDHGRDASRGVWSIIIVVGLVVYLFGQIGAWWNHG